MKQNKAQDKLLEQALAISRAIAKVDPKYRRYMIGFALSGAMNFYESVEGENFWIGITSLFHDKMYTDTLPKNVATLRRYMYFMLGVEELYDTHNKGDDII